MTPDNRPTPIFTRVVHADVRLLVTMRADLRAWLVTNGVGPDDCDAVVLACSEALANSIEHAYHGDPSGEVAVHAMLTGNVLEISVRDHGEWVAPRLDPDNTLDGLHRGRGLEMIRRLMDRTDLVTDDGTTVTMRRRVEMISDTAQV